MVYEKNKERKEEETNRSNFRIFQKVLGLKSFRNMQLMNFHSSMYKKKSRP